MRAAAPGADETFDGMVGRSPAMLDVFRRISRLAPLDGSVLIQGETGTGKELVAQSLHSRSRRRDRPFVPVHAGAIPETLFEAQMFGHEAGAFTDARETRPGWFETANGGTLFLDEIGEMPLTAQAKLLRVMEERQVTRLGSRRSIAVDVRIIAATNRSMDQAIAAGEFRLDMYHRFGATLNLPPLSARAGDVDLLISHLLARLAAELNTTAEISPEARTELRRRSWPGNVRELQRVLREALIASDGGLLTMESFGPDGAFGAQLTPQVPALTSLNLAEAMRSPLRRPNAARRASRVSAHTASDARRTCSRRSGGAAVQSTAGHSATERPEASSQSARDRREVASATRKVATANGRTVRVSLALLTLACIASIGPVAHATGPMSHLETQGRGGAQRGQVMEVGVADLSRVGLGTDATVVVVFGADCEACEASIGFYKRLLGLPAMDGSRQRLVVISKGGVLPVGRILDRHDFSPHRLTSGPAGRIEGVQEPPAVIVLDATGRRRGTWLGPLTSVAEGEILAMLGGGKLGR